MILFKTSLTLSTENEANKNVRVVVWAAHTLMLFLLKILQEPYIHTSTIGKLNNYLNVIVIGLSHNTIVDAGELFPFMYISVSRFISGGKPTKSNENEEESDKIEIG